MTFRTMLLTAALVLPLAFDSTPVMAQGRGAERSAVATTQSQPQANGNGEEQRQDQAPPGVMRRLAAGLIDMLPAGIVRRFGAPELDGSADAGTGSISTTVGSWSTSNAVKYIFRVNQL